MDTTASDTLIRTNLDFLRRHAPFDRMEAEALRFLGERLATAFYPAEAEILMPEDGPPRFFYIVYRGKVQARQVGSVSVTEYSTLTLGPSEGFPIGAISAGRPSTNGYIAVEDSYCFQLPAADFLKLQELSPTFQLFCTRYIASLLNQSREQLQVQFSQRAAEQQGEESAETKEEAVAVAGEEFAEGLGADPGISAGSDLADEVDHHLESAEEGERPSADDDEPHTESRVD